ncbi:MAG: glutamate--tRNA ligase [Candidatus Aminicenantes bacterium]|nr:glutamate--tRNA ligase [Candidatus Aminicenantes bacterium]
MNKIRVRFAPSPTGYLHVGAARTALYNWLFARHFGGVFVLRIEDTDVERSSGEMSRAILEGLQWLGLNWDEGPVFQSERLDLYREKAEELVRNGHAYPCYCLPEEIEERKKSRHHDEKIWGYDRHCRFLSSKERKRYEDEGRSRAIRFKVRGGRVSYEDMLHGSISVNADTIEDFVLLRRDGLPTYHLSVVVDDILQKISHIIRGDDHISNTPKQILLYKAFGSLSPRFAHQALILGPDKKKLSKRHGVTSVLAFREQGYFSLSLINFLCRMNWLPGDEEKIFTLEELYRSFSMDKLSKASPVFDPVKLQWLNGLIISQMTAEDMFPYIKKIIKKRNLWQEKFEKQPGKIWMKHLIDLYKTRVKTVIELVDGIEPFIVSKIKFDPAGAEKYLADDRLPRLLAELRKDFEQMIRFDAGNTEEVLRARAEKEGVKAGLLIHAVRMLVLGRSKSPGIFEVLELLGKEKTVSRLSVPFLASD